MSNRDGDTGSGHNLSTKTIYLGTWHSILCQEPVGGVRNKMVISLGMNFLNARNVNEKWRSNNVPLKMINMYLHLFVIMYLIDKEGYK